MKGNTAKIREQMKKINLNFFELITHEIRNTDFTAPQILVCRLIKGQPQKISSISGQMRLSNSTISSIIDRLEKKGYVKRVRDPEDRRIVWVTETEKLVQLRKEMPVLQDDFFEFLWEDLDSQTFEQIYHSLKLLADHLQQKVQQHKQNDDFFN